MAKAFVTVVHTINAFSEDNDRAVCAGKEIYTPVGA